MNRTDRIPAALLLLLGGLAFGLSYGQAPLYYSNQNQYFLHGLAWAGKGYLADDWLANTLDPTPVFTGLVGLTYRYLHPWAYYVYYLVLLGIYFGSLVGLFGLIAGNRNTPRLRLAFALLIIAIHASLARWLSYRWFGLDYPWYFQAGLAGQYILGAMFQPSAFGVLLILSIYLFLKDRLLASVVCIGLAASINSTYLLGGGILTFSYLLVLLGQRRMAAAVGLGIVALLLVLPVSVYALTTFGPTSRTTFTEAQEVLAHFRLPHHCQVSRWLDAIAVAQIAWIVLAMVLVRGSRLFVIMGVTLAVSVILTLIQVATGSDFLALLFPWRTSVFLVPLATGIVLARLVTAAADRLDRPAVAGASTVGIVALAAAGVALTAFRQGFQSGDEERPMMVFVRENKEKGDLYLIPVQVPQLAKTTRGSLSSDFKPLAAKRTDSRLIPIDLQGFRLTTGAPIFVDFKSIPYKDVEVLEWRRRLDENQRFYEAIRAGRFDDIREPLRRHGITHLVVRADLKIEESGVEIIYEDDFYRVYQLKD